MSQKRIVLVASVSIMHGDEVLVVRESTSTVLDKWNFPSGRIE